MRPWADVRLELMLWPQTLSPRRYQHPDGVWASVPAAMAGELRILLVLVQVPLCCAVAALRGADWHTRLGAIARTERRCMCTVMVMGCSVPSVGR